LKNTLATGSAHNAPISVAIAVSRPTRITLWDSARQEWSMSYHYTYVIEFT
jgi:hypothetical protein